MASLITSIIKYKDVIFKAILGLSVAFLISYSIIVHKQNKMLSESLQMANNNIEAYQGIVSDYNQANNTLMLTAEQFAHANDSLLQKMNEIAKQNNIKTTNLNTAATQTQIIDVSGSKGVRGEEPLSTVLLEYNTYTDSIKYNDLTKIYYTIGEDTVSVRLDIQNTQYLYTYKTREYKNKKNFLKRLLTLDFKKVNKYKYEIINTNDLLNTSDVRVVEVTE